MSLKKWTEQGVEQVIMALLFELLNIDDTESILWERDLREPLDFDTDAVNTAVEALQDTVETIFSLDLWSRGDSCLMESELLNEEPLMLKDLVEDVTMALAAAGRLVDSTLDDTGYLGEYDAVYPVPTAGATPTHRKETKTTLKFPSMITVLQDSQAPRNGVPKVVPVEVKESAKVNKVKGTKNKDAPVTLFRHWMALDATTNTWVTGSKLKSNGVLTYLDDVEIEPETLAVLVGHDVYEQHLYAGDYVTVNSDLPSGPRAMEIFKLVYDKALANTALLQRVLEDGSVADEFYAFTETAWDHVMFTDPVELEGEFEAVRQEIEQEALWEEEEERALLEAAAGAVSV